MLGGLLRAQRIAADLSLRELAERTKVSNAYLSQLERGLHEPSLSVLRAISSALGVPLGPLLTRVGMLEAGEEGKPVAAGDRSCDPARPRAQRAAADGAAERVSQLHGGATAPLTTAFSRACLI